MRNIARNVFLSNHDQKSKPTEQNAHNNYKDNNNNNAPMAHANPQSTDGKNGIIGESGYPIALCMPFIQQACIIIDTREQLPYEFPFKSILSIKRNALPSGDYSIEGYESIIAVERKSQEDFLNSVTNDHERFFAEIKRLSKMPFARVVVECSLEDILMQRYHNQVSPATVMGNVMAIEAMFGVPICWAGNRPCAVIWTIKFLEKAWKSAIQKGIRADKRDANDEANGVDQAQLARSIAIEVE